MIIQTEAINWKQSYTQSHSAESSYWPTYKKTLFDMYSSKLEPWNTWCFLEKLFRFSMCCIALAYFVQWTCKCASLDNFEIISLTTAVPIPKFLRFWTIARSSRWKIWATSIEVLKNPTSFPVASKTSCHLNCTSEDLGKNFWLMMPVKMNHKSCGLPLHFIKTFEKLPFIAPSIIKSKINGTSKSEASR